MQSGKGSSCQLCGPFLLPIPHSSSFSSAPLPPHSPFSSSICSLFPEFLGTKGSKRDRTEQQTHSFNLEHGFTSFPATVLLGFSKSPVCRCFPAAPWWPELAAEAGIGVEVQTFTCEEKKMILLAARMLGSARWG